MPTTRWTRTELDSRDIRTNWLWFQPSRIPTLVDKVKVCGIHWDCVCMQFTGEETGSSSERLLYHKSHISKHALVVKEVMWNWVTAWGVGNENLYHVSHIIVPADLRGSYCYPPSIEEVMRLCPSSSANMWQAEDAETSDFRVWFLLLLHHVASH